MAAEPAGGATLLLVPHYHEALRTTLLPLALLARDRFGVRPVVLLRFEPTDASLALLADAGVEARVARHGDADFAAVGAARTPPGKLLRWLALQRAEIRDRREHAERLLDELAPVAGVFATSESPAFEAFINAAAGEKGIPTVLVQWAFSGGLPLPADPGGSSFQDRVLRALQRQLRSSAGVRVSRFIGDGNARWLAAMDERAADVFRRGGVPDWKVVATGHPEHDLLAGLRRRYADPADRARARAALGVPPEGPLLLLVREAVAAFGLLDAERDRAGIRATLDALTAIPGGTVVLRPHPRDEPAYYDAIAEAYPSVVSVADGDLYTLVALSDLHVSQGSSTAVWAAALGVPVVLVGWTGLRITREMGELLGEEPVAAPERLAAAVAERLRERTAPRWAPRLDGRARERILALAGIGPAATTRSA